MTTAAAIRLPLTLGTAETRTAPPRRSRRSRRLATAALVLAGLSIPVTGAGSAIGATHAPAHVTVAVVADALVGVVATGKHDV